MSAPTTPTWEMLSGDGGARRPSLDDLGGAGLLDDGRYPPPRNGSQFYAAMCNQQAFALAAVSRMIPSCRMTIAFSAGAPFVAKLETANSLLVPTPAVDFTLADNANGDTTISWLSWKLPPLSCDPRATVNDLTIAKPSVETLNIAPAAGITAVRVKTRSDGTLTDMRVTIEFG